jgi:nucleoside-diphosphate-sugar epimerase
MRVFIAGTGGAIGRSLVPQLVAHGHEVIGTTRRAERLPELRALGVEAVVMDALDAASVKEAVLRAQPDVVVHQMTALAGVTDLARFDKSFAKTNELRTKGTDNLLAAAQAAGVRRVVAQSYTGWPNIREGGPVKTEDAPLDPHPPAMQARSLAAIRYLEKVVLTGVPHGIVLRYGNFYGRGVLDPLVDLVRARKVPIVGKGTGIWSWIHVDDAAAATVRAIEGGAPGVYNVVDDDPAPASEWLPYLAQCVGAKPPLRVPVWLARLLAGEVIVSMMTQIRGSSNAKAKRELGWEPQWKSWREGFRYALGEPVASPAGEGGAMAGAR